MEDIRYLPDLEGLSLATLPPADRDAMWLMTDPLPRDSFEELIRDPNGPFSDQKRPSSGMRLGNISSHSSRSDIRGKSPFRERAALLQGGSGSGAASAVANSGRVRGDSPGPTVADIGTPRGASVDGGSGAASKGGSGMGSGGASGGDGGGAGQERYGTLTTRAYGPPSELQLLPESKPKLR